MTTSSPYWNQQIDCSVEPLSKIWDYPAFECGLLDVPLDYHDPSAGMGRVHYMRVAADPNVERKGTIFVDPGTIYSR